MSCTVPFRAPLAPPSNSIHPSLNPSSIRIRGVEFFIPWDAKAEAHMSRGTISARTARLSRFGEGVRDIVRAHPLRAFEFHDPFPGPSLLEKFRRDSPHVDHRDHRYRPVERMQVAWDDTAVPRRDNIPTAVFHEPRWTKESDRHRGVGQRPLQRVNWVSRFSCSACAPIVERQTTRSGLPDSIADRKAEMTA